MKSLLRLVALASILLTSMIAESKLALTQSVDVKTVEEQFGAEFEPFLKTHCQECHNQTKQEGKLDLTQAVSVDAVRANHPLWEIVLHRLEQQEMPPADFSPQPSEESRQLAINWLKDLRRIEADRNAGDPGPVLARRLSNAEYDNSIRDLTGVDIRPTREFPVDPANEAGFDNSGESLSMSPGLLTKYLTAARLVADHAVLTPKEILFAPYPVVAETDRDKFCVQRIVDFYEKHRVDYGQYFLMLWEYQHREQVGKNLSSLQDFAEESHISAKYADLLWQMLHSENAIGPQKELQEAWAQLPFDIAQIENCRSACDKLSQLVKEIRTDLDVPLERLKVNGMSAGSQPLILWWNQKVAENRRSFPGDGDDAAMDEARKQFCLLFPNEFSVSSRGHYSNAELGANIRLLSAGFHLMQGYFRDDLPLRELILTETENQELEQLWQDLNYATQAPIRQYKDFLFFERAEPPQFAGGEEFDFARPENRNVTSQENIQRLKELFLNKAVAQEANQEAQEAIQKYFEGMNQSFRWIEETQHSAESMHLESLLRFAERAWRRPLTSDEQAEIRETYRSLREHETLSHEDAIRDSLAGVLMSPHFSYRLALVAIPDGSGSTTKRAAALTDYELASRLSFFLWASIPDQELLQHAAAGDLHQASILTSQVRRMMKDSRIRGLATEFLGNWLDFRRFEEHNAVDRERFPVFNNELRQAMYEEPIRFFVDLAERDGSATEFISADHTFANVSLAAHYGFDVTRFSKQKSVSAGTKNEWLRFDNVAAQGRGGFLPMAVFLTKNSPGLRTSPVKRGYWIVHRLLGEHIPAPPLNVPELPKAEADFDDLTLSQLLAKHRDHTACAGCHQKFDSFGLVFEGYGPVGEKREIDLGGHPVQTHATFPDGSAGDGLESLRTYLNSNSRDEFIDTLVRQTFAYGLGRSLQLSDTAAIESTKEKLREQNYQLSTLLEAVATSPQFVNKRVDEH
jgi:mono/diheme cytochrome c family protein